MLDTDTDECINRVVFTSHAALDAVAAVIWFLGAGLAMSSGVGGGGIFVPLGVILLRFASKPSTGLSQASIFGAASAGLLINSRSRHPVADRPLIDFDMALFLSPMEMAGALLGVIVQQILPTWAVILLMAVILGYTAVKTFQKACSTLKKERAAKAQAQLAQAELDAAKDAKDPDGASQGDAAKVPVAPEAPVPAGPTEAWQERSPAVDEWLARDAATPWRSVALLLAMWVLLLVLLVVKGGKGVSGVFPYCSTGYWIFTALSFVWLFCFALAMGYSAVSKSIQKAAVGYPFVEGDIVWNWQKFRFYCCITFAAGVVAGLIGIGGGMVLGPMMLQLGLLPQVSTATTATMIVLTSSSAALMYVTSGLVPPSYAGVYFGIAFIGAYIGKSQIDSLVKKHKLTAIIIFILASIIAFASAMMSVNGVLIYSKKNWVFEGANSVC